MTLTRETLAALQAGYVPAEALPGVLDGWHWVADRYDEGRWEPTRYRVPLDIAPGRMRVAVVCHALGKPARHLLPAAELGDLPDALAAHAPVLLACHVARVLAGLEGVGVALPWKEVPVSGGATYGPGFARRTPTDQSVTFYNQRTLEWRGHTHPDMGRCATPNEARAAADAAALRAGFALLNPDGIALPWPEVTS